MPTMSARIATAPGPNCCASSPRSGCGPMPLRPGSGPAAPSWGRRMLRGRGDRRVGPPGRAARIADAVDRAQGRPSPHPGHFGRVHPADRAARPARAAGGDLRQLRDPHGAAAGERAWHGVGISSGANLLAAIEVARDLDETAVVATVFATTACAICRPISRARSRHGRARSSATSASTMCR